MWGENNKEVAWQSEKKSGTEEKSGADWTSQRNKARVKWNGSQKIGTYYKQKKIKNTEKEKLQQNWVVKKIITPVA